MTYTSTDWHLLRECPAPVLLAAEDKWHRTKPVLAALDLGTKNARQAGPQ
jgi:universal stress protein E